MGVDGKLETARLVAAKLYSQSPPDQPTSTRFAQMQQLSPLSLLE